MAGRELTLALKIQGKLESSYPESLRRALQEAKSLENKYGALAKKLKDQQKLTNANGGNKYLQQQMKLAEQLGKMHGVKGQSEEYAALKRSQAANNKQYAEAKAKVKELGTQYQQAQQTMSQMKKRQDELSRSMTAARRKKDEYKTELAGLEGLRRQMIADSGMPKKKFKTTEKYKELAERIESTKRMLEGSKVAAKAAEENYKSYGKAIRQAENELKQMGAAYNKAKTDAKGMGASMTSQLSRIRQLQSSLNASGYSTASFGASQLRLRTQIAQATAEMQRQAAAAARLRQQQAHTQQLRQSQSQAAFDFNNAQSNFGSAVSTAQQVMSPLASAIDNAMEFEYAMSKVRALTQSANIRRGYFGQVNEEMAQLEAQARVLGATTEYTMTQVANAQGFYGLAGWKTNQILAAMPSTLDLATASGADFARVADVISDDMTAMGLKAGEMIKPYRDLNKQVEASTHFMDVYAYALTNSNLNLENLHEGWKYAAPIASEWGMSLHELAAMQMMEANTGIKGSQAGTGMRMGLLRLVGPPKKAGKALDDLGMSMSDAMKEMQEGQAQLRTLGPEMNRILDSDLPSSQKFTSLITELSAQLSKLNPDERLAKIDAIFGKNAATFWTKALNPDTVKDYLKALEDMEDIDGYNAQVAGTMRDNTRTQVELLKSSIDAVQNSVGTAFLSTVSSISKVLSPILTNLSEWIQQNQTLVAAIGMAVAAVMAFGVTIAGFGAVAAAYSYGMATIAVATDALKLKWISAGTSMTAFRAQIAANYAMLNGLSLASMQTSFVAAMASMRTSMLGVIASARTMAVSVMASMSSLSLSSIMSSAAAAVRGLAAAFMTAAGSALSMLVSLLPIIAIAAAIGLAAYLIYSNWSTVGPYLMMIWNMISGAVQTAWTIIQPAIAQMGAAFTTLSTSIGGSQSVISLLVGAFAMLGTAVGGVLSTIITTAAHFISMLIGVLGGIVTFVTGVLAGDWSTAWEGLCQIGTSLVQGMINTIKSLFGGLGETIMNVLDIGKGVLNGDVKSVVDKKNARTAWQNGQAGDQALARSKVTLRAQEMTAAQNQIAQLSNNVLQIMQQNQQTEQGQQFAQISQQLLALMKTPEKNAETQNQIAQLSQQMMQSIQAAQEAAKAQGNAEAEAGAQKSAEQFAQIIQSMQAAQQQQQQTPDMSAASEQVNQVGAAASSAAGAIESNGAAVELFNQGAATAGEAFQQIPTAMLPMGETMNQLNANGQMINAALVQQNGSLTVNNAELTAANSALTHFNSQLTAAGTALSTFNSALSSTNGGLQALSSNSSSAASSISALGSAAQSAVASMQSAASAAASAASAAASAASSSAPAANYRGGIYPKGQFLSWIAERGPESIIPIDGSQRAIELWQQTGAMLGVYPGEVTMAMESTPKMKEQMDALGNLAEYQGISDNLIWSSDSMLVRAAKQAKQREIVQRQRILQAAGNKEQIETVKNISPTLMSIGQDELGNLRGYNGISDNIIWATDSISVREAKQACTAFAFGNIRIRKFTLYYFFFASILIFYFTFRICVARLSSKIIT